MLHRMVKEISFRHYLLFNIHVPEISFILEPSVIGIAVDVLLSYARFTENVLDRDVNCWTLIDAERRRSLSTGVRNNFHCNCFDKFLVSPNAAGELH